MPAIAAAPAFYAAIAGGAATVGATVLSNRASGKAAKQQARTAQTAAQIEAASQKEALDFAKQQEATRQAEWQKAQDQNYRVYLTQRKDLEPYRRAGAGAIGQMARPISGYRAGALGQIGG